MTDPMLLEIRNKQEQLEKKMDVLFESFSGLGRILDNVVQKATQIVVTNAQMDEVARLIMEAVQGRQEEEDESKANGTPPPRKPIVN